MKRKIIHIDENKCTGCGECIPACPEGAIQIIDGKAILVSDLFCDGLGSCLGHCPEGAIHVEEREAEAYDEEKTMSNIVKQGKSVVHAHIQHLKEHGDEVHFQEALNFLKQNKMEIPHEENIQLQSHSHSGCPGSMMKDYSQKKDERLKEDGKRGSHLLQWPVQMHLISPAAPYFKRKDLLLAADCTAFTVGDFHKDCLQGKSLCIACPKLDSGREIYIGKIRELIDEAQINTLTVMIMEVPCCGGLLQLALEAVSKAKRKIPIKEIVVGIQGDILSEDWVGT
ncbi:MAG: 4Fe-4S binding protein [Candidatus Aureabacteria bacterium]|nr:4Fe-4S binding protein [Candidatus Auribacterota bacterium]